MADPLVPCPFDACQNLRRICNWDYIKMKRYMVMCSKCHAMGPVASSMEEAEELWNERSVILNAPLEKRHGKEKDRPQEAD